MVLVKLETQSLHSAFNNRRIYAFKTNGHARSSLCQALRSFTALCHGDPRYGRLKSKFWYLLVFKVSPVITYFFQGAFYPVPCGGRRKSKSCFSLLCVVHLKIAIRRVFCATCNTYACIL
ncbi:hypothetical protein BDV25DRAFT_148557 [Aspergillus avenaceus]|uniref:Uncharacterized protein n=1 Tax=Aspergillus avenaceus TaxID=36643 RepID=A0A5N6U5E0_ASPAV|nr:hypothetical protein BDV25DRAFT_148557 [Aspergillus avenaceus]